MVSSLGWDPLIRRDKMPRATVNGVDMYYEVHGKGVPLVMIQGFAGNNQAWFFQTPVFRKYYKVIIFDNRGIGRTDKSSEPYTIRTMADDVIGLLDYLAIDKAHILGLSLGGVVAQEIAISYPERVIKLVLGSTFAGREVKDVHPEMMDALGVREGSTDVDISNIDFRKLMNFMVSAAFNKRLYRMVLVPLSKYSLRSVDPEGYLRQMESVAGHDTLDRLHLIKSPTLVMTGTGDRLVLHSMSDLIASRIRNARLVKVKGGSHAFFMEMRGRFNKEVLDFLRGG
jgi:pimeloyl-ACP methyl ester carboxylesterase